MRRELLLLFVLISQLSFAQVQFPDSFLAKSESWNLEWNKLADSTSKIKFFLPDSTLNVEFELGIFMPKEKYRILIFFQEEGNPSIPHIKSTLKANHFARNEENTFVSFHSFLPKSLEKHNVDWGATFFFKPKTSLSLAAECQMVSLFKHDYGTVHLLYLFDDFSREVEEQLWNPIFLNEPEEQ